MKFTKVEGSPSFPALESQVLERWRSERTYEISIERTKGKREFVVYDGPPFPTGTPHHGTIFVTILKDLIPRYKTMRGYYVPRAWGWDVHGLPIETQAEKDLGITEKGQIEKGIGVAAFNDECRRIVSHYNEAWRTYIDRIGRWVDFDTPYSTGSRDFMESVIWAFAESYKKGLIYKDYRVTPYCYRCETPLSISDTRLDDATRLKQDRSVTVKFKANGEDNLYLLAWTTTPWTLPSNRALAVGAEIEYSIIAVRDELLVLASERIAAYAVELGEDYEVRERVTGSELARRGITYQPLFPYASPSGSQLITAPFVSTEDGTGIVHLAPAFGEDDYWACRASGIYLFDPVDEKGHFTSEVEDFAGRNVHEVVPDIIRHLKKQGAVLRDETLEHNYPHCWRCRSPLIYKAVDAWYYNVGKLKENLLENNKKIAWYPDVVREGRFGKWLENARDWNISRNRFWATPIPVWDCHECGAREVLGSVKEIEERAKQEIPDLHKEYLDAVEYPCSCGSTMRHTREVIDGWFESGSMPYGQYHYPFEHEREFHSHFPADLVIEYVGQIRGWFYVMHVLTTGLFDSPSFKNALVHGTLLASDGKKMSKSLKNYTDPMLLLDTHGADALRAYLLSSSAVQLSDLSFRDGGIEGMVKSLLLPYWNALSFFTTYAEIDGIESDSLDLTTAIEHGAQLDLFILSEMERLVAFVTERLEVYDIESATKAFPEFLDTLNNWYIRRSRERAWSDDPELPSKRAFYAVLHRVLTRFTQLLAPFCPFITEVVWERLGHVESVHLSQWPDIDSPLIHERLSDEVATVRELISAGLALRAKHQLRVRQPLSTVRLALTKELDLERYRDVIAEELNVKEVVVVKEASEIASQVGKAQARLLGPKYGRAVQEIIAALKRGDFTVGADGSVSVAGVVLEPHEVEVQLVGREGLAVEAVSSGVVALDLEISPELEIEGHARDLVRHIQELRKEASLEITDRIELGVSSLDDVLERHSSYVMRETLTLRVVKKLQGAAISKEVEIGRRMVNIELRRYQAT